jgi:hypothetical protein
MIEQLTLLLATPIAKAVLDKFYEGLGSNGVGKVSAGKPGHG